MGKRCSINRFLLANMLSIIGWTMNAWAALKPETTAMENMEMTSLPLWGLIYVHSLIATSFVVIIFV